MKDQLSKNEIRGIFMRNGFTVKEGCDDLKDYVYAAAYDLLKAQEERHRTIEARLSSIEKLLSAESKPDKHEPEWRPMSEAPCGIGPGGIGQIKVRLKISGIEYFAYDTAFGTWMCSITPHPSDRGMHFNEYEIEGWHYL